MEAVSRTPVTLDEVAKAAGVSRATASRVFTRNPKVSESARQAVERAATALGYIPNRAARSLAAGRSESIGVVIPDPASRLFRDPNVARLLRGVGDELSVHGLQMVLFAPQSDSDVARLEQYLAGGHVDAVLLVMMFELEALPARLQSRGVPVVFGGHPRNGHSLSFVHVDNHIGGKRATEHLIEQGRRRIAHLADRPHSPRSQGYREAMWNAALRSDLVEHGDSDREGGEMAMARLLSRVDDVDAVFAATDEMAIGAMWVLQALGRRVPDDVAIIGFDDSPPAALTQPSLSSVRQPMEDMGREMARLVLDMNGSQDPQVKLLEPALAVRGSSARPVPSPL